MGIGAELAAIVVELEIDEPDALASAEVLASPIEATVNINAKIFFILPPLSLSNKLGRALLLPAMPCGRVRPIRLDNFSGRAVTIIVSKFYSRVSEINLTLLTHL